MSDPKRLLEGAEGDALALDMLRAAKAYSPRPDSRAKVMFALGVGGGLAAGTALGTPDYAAMKAVPAMGAKLAFMKWLGPGVLVCALVVGAMEVGRSASAPVERARVQPSAPIAPSAPSPRRAIAEPDPKREPEPEPVSISIHALPSVPSAPRAPRRNVRAEGLDVSSIGQEIALLDRATRAHRSGRSDEALRVLDEHRMTFPAGALSAEAEVLRIELLAERDPAGARLAAERWLASHPKSMHARKLRVLAEPNP